MERDGDDSSLLGAERRCGMKHMCRGMEGGACIRAHSVPHTEEVDGLAAKGAKPSKGRKVRGRSRLFESGLGDQIFRWCLGRARHAKRWGCLLSPTSASSPPPLPSLGLPRCCRRCSLAGAQSVWPHHQVCTVPAGGGGCHRGGDGPTPMVRRTRCANPDNLLCFCGEWGRLDKKVSTDAAVGH